MDILRPSIAVLTLDTPEFRGLGDFTAVSKLDYCRRHCYRFVREMESLDPARPPAWSKVKLLLRELPHHDLCLWIDADAMILNPEGSIDALLREHQIGPDVDLIISADANGINSGVFLAKRTPASSAFFSAVYACDDLIDHAWWEQAAMWRLLREGWPLRVAYVPKRAINSYPHDYRPGDFVLHTPATPNRLELLKHFASTNAVVEQPLFSARGDFRIREFSVNALDDQSTRCENHGDSPIIIESDRRGAPWELLNTHAKSRVHLRLHAPAEIAGFVDAVGDPHNGTVEYLVDHNHLGRISGGGGTTRPIRLAAGPHVLHAIRAGPDFDGHPSGWSIRSVQDRTLPPSPPALFAAPDRLAVVTVACYDEWEIPDRLRNLLESACRQGIWLHVWGVGEEYGSHTDAKVLRFRRWLRALPPDVTHLVYLDGRDTVVQGDAAAICDAYNRLGSPPLLFSAERLSSPVGAAEWCDRWPSRMAGRNFLNSGCFMAERTALTHALDVLLGIWIEAVEGRQVDGLRRLAPGIDEEALSFALRWKVWNAQNDQYLWQTAVLSGALTVRLDDECRLAATMSTAFIPIGDNEEWEVRSERLRARGTNHSPPILHVPGIAPIEVLHAWAEHLGLIDRPQA